MENKQSVDYYQEGCVLLLAEIAKMDSKSAKNWQEKFEKVDTGELISFSLDLADAFHKLNGSSTKH